MTAEWLLNWWNLIFLLPFGLALMYLGLYTVSGITFGDGDVDHDFDVDHDVDVDHDMDVDHDLDSEMAADHDAGAGSDADHDADGGPAAGHGAGPLAALSWLGVGRVPVSILLTVLLLTWGVVGFIANVAMEQRGASSAYISVPLSAVVSLLTTRLIVTLIVRYLPLYETTARRRHELLGSVGEAIFPIDGKFGMVIVRDDTGELFQVPCRVAPQAASIPKGAPAQLVAYNAKLQFFYVSPPVTSTTTGVGSPGRL